MKTNTENEYHGERPIVPPPIMEKILIAITKRRHAEMFPKPKRAFMLRWWKKSSE